MLKGTLTYRDIKNGYPEEVIQNEKWSTADLSITDTVTYDVEAVEFPDSLWLNLTARRDDLTEFYKANDILFRSTKVFDKDYTELELGVCRLDVASSIKTNAVNTVFAGRVGSIIKYALEVPNRTLVDDKGYMTAEKRIDNAYIKIGYNCSIPISIEIQSKYVDLKLSYTDNNNNSVYKTLKEKDKYGNVLSPTPIIHFAVKKSEEYLGFKEEKVEETSVPVWGMYQTIEEVIQANPNKNTSWILERHYEIATRDTVDKILQSFMDTDDFIAFDTETTGLNVSFLSKTGEGDTIVGFSLSSKPGEGYYFPLAHKLFDNVTDDIEYFMTTKVKPILEGKNIICHNTAFDWKVGYLYGINTNVVFDTLVAFSCTYRYQYGKGYETGLKALAKNILGLDMFDLEDFVIGEWGKDSDLNFSCLPYELVRRYATADADMTLSLFYWLKENDVLTKFNAQRVFDLEVQFAKVVAYSEYWGYKFDITNLPKMMSEIEKGIEEHKQKLLDIVGHDFNPNSSVQLKKIMYEELGIEKIGGQDSTKAEILKELAKMTNADDKPLYPFADELLKYRSLEGTYTKLIQNRDKYMSKDGYIFPHIFAFGTDTGRVSIKDPNYQSYDKIVKHYIVPRMGYLHFDCDYSQIEYRVLASMAQQENLCDALSDPDMDYHTYQAARMFNVPYASVTSSLRKQSKGINFGLPYGMGDRSLGIRIFGKATPENTAKAAQLRKKYFQGQEKIQSFFDVVRSQGVANGYTETWLGRRRYYDKRRFSEPEIRRQAGNHCIQGTAADIYKMGVTALFDMICREGWLGKVLINAFVHDEILVEIHQSINPYEFLAKWREEYEVKIKGFCKLYAGCGFGMNWYVAKSQDLPPQFIQECIDKASTMEWNGDLNSFLEQCDNDYFDYKVRRVKDYITDKSSDGQIIKPLINSLLIEVTAEKLGVTEKDFTKEYPNLNDRVAKFKEVYDVTEQSYNLLSPSDVSVNKDGGTEDTVNIVPIDNTKRLIESCIDFGIAVDTDKMILYLRFEPNRPSLMNFIKSLCTDNGYALRFVVKNENKVSIMSTKYSIKCEDTFALQDAYRQITV